MSKLATTLQSVMRSAIDEREENARKNNTESGICIKGGGEVLMGEDELGI